MGNNYSYYQEFANKNKLEREKIINSDVYRVLVDDLKLKLNENLFICNIQSMSNKNNPTKLRIRNDKFLRLVSKGNGECCLISGIKINDLDVILIFFGYSFIGYNFSTKSSNSFIIFDYDDLVNKFKSKNNSVQTKNNHDKTKYMFYVTCIKENDNFYKFDKKMFLFFFDSIKEINFDFYKYQKSTNLDQDIPKINREVVNKVYSNLCSIYKTNGFKFCNCVNWKEIEKSGNYNPDIHHFVPKNYFKNKIGLVDWGMIHNPINLIPLCSFCHKKIHSSKKNISIIKEVFYNIVDSYKKYDRFFEFNDFLKQNTNFESIEDLFNFYIKG